MAASPYDGLYWETNIPLSLYKSLQDLMERNKKDPNTPNSRVPSSERQWLSLPRAAESFRLKHSLYTFADSADFFTPNGIRTLLGSGNKTPDFGKEFDYDQPGYGAQIARSLDPNIFTWYPVAYNSDAFPLNVGVEAAVDKAVSLILGNTSKVFLIGHGKGAVVASKLYDEFRSGRLVGRRADLLGVFNFGNPLREEGHTIPGGIDPGGHGIAPLNERLVDTEDLVWEFSAPNDPMSSLGDDLIDGIATLLYTAFDTTIDGPTSLLTQMSELISSPLYGKLPVLLPFRLALSSGALDVNQLLRTLIKEFFSSGGSHDEYHKLLPVAGSRLNAIDTAIVAIQNLVLTNPPAVVSKSVTEVLTINYRQPVSVSEIAFEALRRNCYIELWYLDRSGNWRQMRDENSAAISLRVGHADSISWYKFHTYTYPIVAKSIQYRISRVADSLIGNTSYSVGIRNTLVRRNVYNRSSGLQGLDDENDALGNIVSKVIKDWDASKAIDDNTDTFWRSMPMPDPDAVVSLYLDTRDSAGNAQLIDKVYLDPVYSGQSLNLYYSNDESVTSKKLNPASLIPVPDFPIGTTISDSAGTSGTGSTATLRLNTSPNVSVGDSVTVAGVVPKTYNGTHTLTGVSKTAPFSISYSSTATGSQTVSGYVTTKGQQNFRWIADKGLVDAVPNDASASIYRCPFAIGPMVSQDCWIGIQWTPSFNAYSQKSSVVPVTTAGVVQTGNTATLQLRSAPNVSVGDTISVTGMLPTAYNGTYTVTAVSNTVPYTVSFLCPAGTGAYGKDGFVITNNFKPGLRNIVTTAASVSGSTATLTLGSNPEVVVGDIITVSGITPTAYNGTHTVTAASTSAPWTVSYVKSGITGSQTVAGTVSNNTRVKMVGITSPTFNGIHSVYDTTTKEVIYSKSKDQNDCTFDVSTKILRVPSNKISASASAVDSITIYHGTNGPAPTQLDLFEALPENTTGTQWWPRVFYDTSNAQISLQISQPNGGAPLVHSAPLNILFEANTTLNIVVGWKYTGTTPTAYISVRTNRQLPMAFLEITSIDFPKQITMDGKIGFKQWRGTFGAHVVKQESYSLSSESFLANPPVYCNPDPILLPETNSVAPASSLNQAVMAVDWTSQQFAAGGAHSSTYSDKEWTPIWVNYFAEKGFLYLPETTSMKYLKLEFTQLTPEPYPVYDQGIQTMYNVYPINITQTATQPRGLIGVINNIFGGIGSINWLNPSSVNQAMNSIFGRTVQPAQLQIGPGFTTMSLPNTTQTAVTESVRTEATTAAIYRRTPMNPYALVQNYLATLFNPNRSQGIQPWVPASQQKLIVSQTTIKAPTSANPPALPIQGQDWYVFPGQTLRMPANVVDGVTKSQVVTQRATSKAVRKRFTTTAVHQYEVKTLTMDADIAYFAGLREVQPYVVTHIDYEDPPEFAFDNYDASTGWTSVNIEKYSSGAITAKPNPYTILNGGFNATIDYWTGSGWDWETSEGHTLDETWQPGTPFIYGAAHTIGNGTSRTLVSQAIPVEAGAAIKFGAWVVYKNVTYNNNAKIFVDLIGLDANDNVISSSIGLGVYMEIKQGTPGTMPVQNFFDTLQPSSSVAQIGVKAIPLYGSINLATVSTSIRKIKIRLNVNSNVTGGEVWFDDIFMIPNTGVIGSATRQITTNSKFSKVRCDFRDTGARRSDPMWAYLDSWSKDDPRRTILAHYVSTIPSNMPDGTWGDSFGTWEDTNIKWGTPYSVVSVNYSEAVYDKKRVIHFFRQASASGSQTGQAGISVRQELNFVPKGLFRICAVFFKERKTTNSMELRLVRVSGNESGPAGPEQYPNGEIYSETLTADDDGSTVLSPNQYRVGRWHTHEGQWIEIPDSMDQTYRVELVLSGDQEDDLFLNDLWVEIAQVRYHVQLGGGVNHDVTPLAYKDNCTVGSTEPVNQMNIEVEIHGSNSYLINGRAPAVQSDKITSKLASMSTDSPTLLTVFGYTFSDDDIGKYVRVEGAGIAGGSLRTTITGAISAKAILAIPCSTTVTNTTAVFGTDNPIMPKVPTSFAYSSVFTPLYLQ